VGERLCIDFINTVDWRGSSHPIEYINTYPDLVKWGLEQGILESGKAQLLLKKAQDSPETAARVLKETVTLREAMYRIFSAVIEGSPPSKEDSSLFNRELSRTLVNAYVIFREGKFVLRWRDSENALERILWPVIHDACELLTSQELARVGKCADEKCGWLFFDTSKNRSRRWCSMNDCGNRAKVRRHYKKKRTGNYQ